MVWDGTRVIMFGGLTDGGARLNDLWWYDPGSNVWSQKLADGATGSPAARQEANLVWDGTRVILFGGQNATGNLNDVWWYDPGANAWTQKLAQGTAGSPPARDDSFATWTGTAFLIFGGFPGPLNDLWSYDPGGNAWTQKLADGAAGSPSRRGSVRQMVWTGTRAILFAGKDGSTYFDDTWSYDPGGNAWTQMKALGAPGSPPGRRFPTIVWADDKMIVFGGEVGSSGNNKNDLWWYYP